MAIMLISLHFFYTQNSLKDICYENVDCILKLLDENTEKAESTLLKKTERSFRGNILIIKNFREYKNLFT